MLAEKGSLHAKNCTRMYVQGGKGPKVGGLALGVLSRLLTVLRLLYTADAADYRVAVQRWFRRSHDRGPRRRGRRWFPLSCFFFFRAWLRAVEWPKNFCVHCWEACTQHRCCRRLEADEEDEVSGWASQLCLWSLNPATAFRSITQQVRSVILTSGTLSPLDSFASEVCTGCGCPAFPGFLVCFDATLPYKGNPSPLCAWRSWAPSSGRGSRRRT